MAENRGIQLITPPPERDSSSSPNTASKRKRIVPQQIQPLDATPNPKPRKQSKHHPPTNDSPTRRPLAPQQQTLLQSTPTRPARISLTKSPHARNPDADYIPPVPISAPRRSVLAARVRRATPIPPYEPPTEVFTPPREVVMTPTISKSSKRKTASKTGTATGKRKELKPAIPPSIKKELPDIDLTAPMPPPSPSDDPLLLSGPIMPSSSPTRPPRQQRDVGVGAWMRDPTPVREDLILYTKGSLPPSSDPDLYDAQGMDDMHPPAYFDWGRQEEQEEPPESSSMMDMDEEDTNLPRMPIFDFGSAVEGDGGGWSDSDDDTPGGPGHPAHEGDEPAEGEGEYTGRWKMVKIRTKLDPPSSATRERMEEWGRPITPFPKKIGRLELVNEDSEDLVDEEIHVDLDLDEEAEVREMSVHLDEEDEEDVVPFISVEDRSLDSDITSEIEEPYNDEIQAHQQALTDTEPQQSVEGNAEELRNVTPSVQHAVLQAPSPTTTSFAHGDNDDEAEEMEVRHMSVEYPDLREDGTEETLADKYFERHRASFSRLPQPLPLNDLDETSTGLADDTSPTPIDEARADGDSSDDETSDVDPGIVRITSADPRAAARAAAILKQHDYDCYTKIVMKEKVKQGGRYSHSSVSELAKDVRRRSVADAGVIKGSRENTKRRRTTLGMGVIGDRVIIPGSPAITLPELLRQAEKEMVGGTAEEKVDTFQTPAQRLFKTPIMKKFRDVVNPTWDGIGEREWTKEDWKLLDGCLTDERLELGARLGMTAGEGLAPVDLVHREDVVRRFIETSGGEELMETFGDAWAKPNLTQRVKALQNKQRLGNVAPPTTPYTSSPGDLIFGASRRAPVMEVPDFTPLGKRAAPPRRSRPSFPPPVLDNTPFTNLPPTRETERPTRRLPPTLLAPRYSHLLEEASIINAQPTSIADASVTDIDTAFTTPNADDVSADLVAPSTPPKATNESTQSDSIPPTTIGLRMKGFIFSYLPTLSKTAPQTRKKPAAPQPGLPLPPLDVLGKHRGPISTPVRPPVPKHPHPKELVVLHPAPVPAPKPTMIPRAKKPQRLVELHPLPPPPSPHPVPMPRGRRSSGGSVKDLVRSFEDLDGRVEKEEKTKEIKRVRSIGDWRKGLPGKGDGRPGWKP